MKKETDLIPHEDGLIKLKSNSERHGHVYKFKYIPASSSCSLTLPQKEAGTGHVGRRLRSPSF